MGYAVSRLARYQNKRMNTITAAADSPKNSIKLLLLGAGESGKSTVLKQMRILHNNGFSEEEYKNQRCVVFSNVIHALHSILHAMQKLDIRFDQPELEVDSNFLCKVSHDLTDCEGGLDVEVAQRMGRIWADKGVQQCYERSNEYQLIDSAKYFLDALPRITQPEYSPTLCDLLRCRAQTTGVVEVHFGIKGMNFRVIDVGGQRSERRKWIHCFSDVNAIIFMTAISAYDQVLQEDDSTNRLHESIRLFDSICNNLWFLSTSVILFLNKTDIFKEKIKKKGLQAAFPSYDGDNSFEDTVCYISDHFLSLNHSDKRQIFTHLTCATDTSQLSFVLNTVIDIIIEQNLLGCGMY